MTNLSVVLLTCDFNESLAELSRTAIQSIKTSEPSAQLIVVDNGSTYGTGFSRNEADIYIKNRVNVGYPGGVNQGFALAKGSFVALANNDIKVTPNWWAVAEEIFTNPKIGTVHFKMVGYDEDPNLGNQTWEGGKERWCSSSFFVVRREAFQVYDENYGAGGYDDYDHHHRMRDKAGWIQAYTNKAAYQHMDSVTYRTMEQEQARAERDKKNKEYFKAKHGMYPDEHFAKLFPEQLEVSWKPFP